MLKIVARDLKETTPDVVVWWVRVPQVKNPAMVICWQGVIIIRPAIEWPTGFFPEIQEGWGERPLKVVYLTHMQRFTTQAVMRVPDVDPLTLLTPGKGVFIKIAPAKAWPKGLIKYTHTKGSVLVKAEDIHKVSKALACKVGKLKTRLFTVDEYLGSQVVLVHRKGLRAVVSVVAE